MKAQADGVKKPVGGDASTVCRRHGFSRRADAVTFAGLDELEKTRVSRVESSMMRLEEMKVPELVKEMDLKAVAAECARGDLDVAERNMGELKGTRAYLQVGRR